MEFSTYKNQAKRLRKELASDGQDISHGQSLELVAKSHGFRDWNTLSAKAHELNFQIGAFLRGKYLGVDFTGKIVSARKMGDFMDVAIDCDAPVKVCMLGDLPVTRKRISARLNKDGRTLAKTSDGQPHVVLL